MVKKSIFLFKQDSLDTTNLRSAINVAQKSLQLYDILTRHLF